MEACVNGIRFRRAIMAWNIEGIPPKAVLFTVSWAIPQIYGKNFCIELEKENLLSRTDKNAQFLF